MSKQPPPLVTAFIFPENLSASITPENLTVEARRIRPDIPKKTRDKQARVFRRRKYKASQNKNVPHSNGTGKGSVDVP
jgi:hypothetical protein